MLLPTFISAPFFFDCYFFISLTSLLLHPNDIPVSKKFLHSTANICGILVRTRPKNITVVTERLLSIAGVEIHGASDEGQMVVTLEEFDEDATAEKMLGIQKVEGVISASMIYHHYEDERLGEEVAQ